ncbi:MAG TPA: signal peptide peptidase SppA [candidate division Zixibacteria bacterium]|nr:signal peptide peptidase SppA [candidate division Zixibacteria bacterium]
MKKKDIILASIITASFILFIGVIFLALVGALYDDNNVALDFGEKIAIIDVHGVISSSANVIRQLKKFGDDSSIPALIIHIDSPGGGVAASQEIYEEIRKVREKGKTVVASMSSLGASGGYYIACAADTIVANPGTITGSIGVIFEIPIIEELLKKVGIRFEVIKSGEMKDAGSFARSITPKEREYLQQVINDTYDQFVEVVVKERDLSHSQVYKLADGRVFTGRQAQKLKLIDELGDLEDAIEIAAKMAGIKGKPRTIKERVRTVTFWDVLSEGLTKVDELSKAENFSPKLQYLYKLK